MEELKIKEIHTNLKHIATNESSSDIRRFFRTIKYLSLDGLIKSLQEHKKHVINHNKTALEHAIEGYIDIFDDDITLSKPQIHYFDLPNNAKNLKLHLLYTIPPISYGSTDFEEKKIKKHEFSEKIIKELHKFKRQPNNHWVVELFWFSFFNKITQKDVERLDIEITQKRKKEALKDEELKFLYSLVYFNSVIPFEKSLTKKNIYQFIKSVYRQEYHSGVLVIHIAKNCQYLNVNPEWIERLAENTGMHVIVVRQAEN